MSPYKAVTSVPGESETPAILESSRAHTENKIKVVHEQNRSGVWLFVRSRLTGTAVKPAMTGSDLLQS